DGYIIEGHVPAIALRRLLDEKPTAAGLAVPGMPIGAPGMEGGSPESYEVVMFGPAGRRTYMRFINVAIEPLEFDEEARDWKITINLCRQSRSDLKPPSVRRLSL